MNTLADRLIGIRDHLSDKETWEKLWEANRVTGYSSGSLMNDLSGIFVTGGKREYPAAFACVSRAIMDLYGDQIKSFPPKTMGYQGLQEMDWEYEPDREHIMNVRVFQEFKNHEWLMNVLDLAIRYAKVWIFS
jgi:hypothetical protein